MIEVLEQVLFSSFFFLLLIKNENFSILKLLFVAPFCILKYSSKYQRETELSFLTVQAVKS